MNSVSLIGRLTRDPEVRATNDSSVAKFSIAVNREFKNSEGKYDADFINCVAFKDKAAFVEKYFHKGMKVALIGRIQTGSYTNKDGQKVYTTDVVVNSCEFCESKSDSNSSPKNEPGPADNNGFEQIPEGIDEELPFN